ncbi:alpha/beta hydrolase [Veronia nyctiphanis]|uniref:Alpha/beta hydrolase n=1 Tax=Veronia nyctiphanis TaxID=1278244 RepID=A0A4Q0YNS8_9GAMM|nr:alpha/beta fold hydrolase [Veronia nyctiphanis]RXJ72105.1 alpha/beta hydrolase [Veronia nyctiphanis]
MADEKHIVLIHGTWGHGSDWAEMVPELEKRGFTVHAPSLRFHDLPILEGAIKMGEVSLRDYVNDLKNFVESLSSPPIIVGLSMGGLLAQLVAARTEHKALALFSPAPAAGIFAMYPNMVKMFYKYFLRWGFWKKPMFPSWPEFRQHVLNEKTNEQAEQFFTTLTVESGRAYAEMAGWMFDKHKSAYVDVEKVKTPVIVFCGHKDKTVSPNIARATAKRYTNSTLVELPESDHVMILGKELPGVMDNFDKWLSEQAIN